MHIRMYQEYYATDMQKFPFFGDSAGILVSEFCSITNHAMSSNMPIKSEEENAEKQKIGYFGHFTTFKSNCIVS